MTETITDLKPGDRMPDGTIYAGISPDTGPLYTTPEDAKLTYMFNEAAAYARELNQQNYLGHNDWRVPSTAELNVLYANRNEGALKGTFNETAERGAFNATTWIKAGWYWSSFQRNNLNFVGAQRFSDGHRNNVVIYEDPTASLRLVRG
jgi:hypothetical protein